MDILWNKIKDMLEIAGYNVAKIKQDLLYESHSDMIITSIPGISILLLLPFSVGVTLARRHKWCNIHYGKEDYHIW